MNSILNRTLLVVVSVLALIQGAWALSEQDFEVPSDLLPYASNGSSTTIGKLIFSSSLTRSEVWQTSRKWRGTMQRSYRDLSGGKLNKNITVESFSAYINQTVEKSQKSIATKEQRIYPGDAYVQEASRFALEYILYDGAETPVPDQELQANYTQFESYFVQQWNQSIPILPEVCSAMNSTVTACLSQTHEQNRFRFWLRNRPVKRRFSAVLHMCSTGMTSLTHWRVERCVLKHKPSTSELSKDHCPAVMHCFLSLREQKLFEVPAAQDNSTSTAEEEDLDLGLLTYDYSEISTKNYGVGMLWASVITQAYEDKVNKMGWIAMGVQVAAELGGIALLGIVCLPCLVGATPLAIGSQLGASLAAFGVGEAIYPSANIRGARRNGTVAMNIFQ